MISEIQTWKNNLFAETRPGGEGATYSQCECGKSSRTGICKDCIEKEIMKLEKHPATPTPPSVKEKSLASILEDRLLVLDVLFREGDLNTEDYVKLSQPLTLALCDLAR